MIMKEIRILEAFGEPIADGGQEAFVFGVMNKMDMTGMRIDCLTAYDCRSEYYQSLVEKKGGLVYSLNLLFSPGKSREIIREPFRQFLKEHHYDVVHIHSGSISVLAIMATEADKAGVKKVIVHSHASGEIDNLKHKLLRFLASIPLSRHVDIYCACSKEAAGWKFEPRFARKAHIIKNGIDTERFEYNPEKRAEIREKLHLQDCFVIGHVGRFTKEKNHEFLINVFEIISRNDPDARLLLTGAGDEMGRIKKLVEEKLLADKVIFTGSVTNVQDYLQAMDVFVLPSRFEGLGIVAIEAQAAGLPVITSDKVPISAKVTDEMMLLDISLDTSLEKWVKEIEKYKMHSRQDLTEQIRVGGYDIRETAKQIANMYLE